MHFGALSDIGHTGATVTVTVGPRRPGECVKLVSSSGKAREILGWHRAQSSLEKRIGTAWAWHRAQDGGQ